MCYDLEGGAAKQLDARSSTLATGWYIFVWAGTGWYILIREACKNYLVHFLRYGYRVLCLQEGSRNYLVDFVRKGYGVPDLQVSA